MPTQTPSRRAARSFHAGLRLLPLLALACVATPTDARIEAPGPGCGSGGGVRAPQEPARFLGHPCRDAECAAHKAGFAWADGQGIADPRDCADAEDSAFAEGCRSFVEDTVTAEQSGFQWARENEVRDRCRCAGAGPRFEAGCEAYVLMPR